MQIVGVAVGYGVATFSCRVGLDRSRSGEDDAFGFPAPRITGTPTHDGNAALDAPSFKRFELHADRLVAEMLQRFAVGPVCWREGIAILFNRTIRSEERRERNECVSPCRSKRLPYYKTKN